MRIALRLASRNLGITWPNPSVGALIVKDGRIVGQGITARGGRPHAETEAIAQAGENARGATLYVTLEPCSHHGQTPPCAEAIIKAGIARVYIACSDPNPLISGRGIALLRQAGIDVMEQLCEAQALELNRGFFSVISKGRPFVALKIASSMDGKIAYPPLPAGEGPRWITGEQSRAYGHLLRSRYDAIATGIGTVLADDPLLTCRLSGLEDRSPVRVVFDRQGRLPKDSNLMKTQADVPVWTLTSPSPAQRERGLKDALSHLANRGITRLLVEAGAELSTAFLQSGLVDRIYWFRAPLMIGNDGLAAITGGFDPQRWETLETRYFGSDSLSILQCSPASSPI